jgi:hypothetical protein
MSWLRHPWIQETRHWQPGIIELNAYLEEIFQFSKSIQEAEFLSSKSLPRCNLSPSQAWQDGPSLFLKPSFFSIAVS